MIGRTMLRPYAALLGLLILFAVGIVYAQDNTPHPVTDDDVAAVAAKMYCPICENEPLDACYNSTCLQWKDEIAKQLREGRTPDEIVNYFVSRYGQHVIGVPDDPILKGLSFFAPIVGTLLALVIGIVTFRRWQKLSPVKETQSSESSENYDDDYRARIEQDLH